MLNPKALKEKIGSRETWNRKGLWSGERKEQSDFNAHGDWFMKIVEGWRRIDNQRGYINAITGQNLVVTKKQYGEHYLALLFPEVKDDCEGKKISPEFPTESKAESFAMIWMNKHPRGLNEH